MLPKEFTIELRSSSNMLLVINLENVKPSLYMEDQNDIKFFKFILSSRKITDYMHLHFNLNNCSKYLFQTGNQQVALRYIFQEESVTEESFLFVNFWLRKKPLRRYSPSIRYFLDIR